MSAPRFTLRLAKQDFKFAVAHFTLFGEERAEPLHGHNYRVAVEISGGELDEVGLLADCDRLKRSVRELCRGLDDRVLLPEASPLLTITPGATEVAVAYGERRYLFPTDEVVLLPLANSSMELLARHLWSRLAEDLATIAGLARLAVEVEETDGQSCRYEAALPPSV